MATRSYGDLRNRIAEVDSQTAARKYQCDHRCLDRAPQSWTSQIGKNERGAANSFRLSNKKMKPIFCCFGSSLFDLNLTHNIRKRISQSLCDTLYWVFGGCTLWQSIGSGGRSSACLPKLYFAIGFLDKNCLAITTSGRSASAFFQSDRNCW